MDSSTGIVIAIIIVAVIAIVGFYMIRQHKDKKMFHKLAPSHAIPGQAATGMGAAGMGAAGMGAAGSAGSPTYIVGAGYPAPWVIDDWPAYGGVVAPGVFGGSALPPTWRHGYGYGHGHGYGGHVGRGGGGHAGHGGRGGHH